MTPERLNELQALAAADSSQAGLAIRTAVREALDAAAKECDVIQIEGNTRGDAFRHGRSYCAARIRRMRDELVP